MDNKTTLQENNTKISNNNTSIDSLIEAINSLPEASSGGSGKLCSGGNILWTYDADGNYTWSYIRGMLEAGKTYELVFYLGNTEIPVLRFTATNMNFTSGLISVDYIGGEAEAEGMGIVKFKDYFSFYTNSEMLDWASQDIEIEFEGDMTETFSIFCTYLREV